MASNPKQKSAYVGVRLPASQPFLPPPGPMGFSDLLIPDTAFDKTKFKVNWHFDQRAGTLLAERIDEHAVEPLWSKFLEECKEAGQKVLSSWAKPLGSVWIEEHEKVPDQERSKIKDNFIQFSNTADYLDAKTGQPKRKTMRASDIHGEPVDLHEANPGMGTIFQPILQPLIFVSPLVKVPTLTFALQGIVIWKLVSRGGGARLHGPEVSDEDLALMGQGFEADDLSKFRRSDKPAAGAPGGQSPRGERYADEADEQEEYDQDIPF